MTHPLMFSDDDPVLARVRAIALDLPGAAEKISHGHPAFYTTKVFAYFGGSIKVAGAYEQHERSIVLQADLVGREALRQRPEAYVPAYLGPAGWTGLDLTDATDWDELADLLEESYRVTAPKRLVAELDGPR